MSVSLRAFLGRRARRDAKSGAVARDPRPEQPADRSARHRRGHEGGPGAGVNPDGRSTCRTCRLTSFKPQGRRASVKCSPGPHSRKGCRPFSSAAVDRVQSQIVRAANQTSAAISAPASTMTIQVGIRGFSSRTSAGRWWAVLCRRCGRRAPPPPNAILPRASPPTRIARRRTCSAL